MFYKGHPSHGIWNRFFFLPSAVLFLKRTSFLVPRAEEQLQSMMSDSSDAVFCILCMSNIVLCFPDIGLNFRLIRPQSFLLNLFRFCQLAANKLQALLNIGRSLKWFSFSRSLKEAEYAGEIVDVFQLRDLINVMLLCNQSACSIMHWCVYVISDDRFFNQFTYQTSFVTVDFLCVNFRFSYTIFILSPICVMKKMLIKWCQ